MTIQVSPLRSSMSDKVSPVLALVSSQSFVGVSFATIP